MRNCLFFLILFSSLASCQGRPQQEVDPIEPLFEWHGARQMKKHNMKLQKAGIPPGENVEKLALHYIAFRKMKVEGVRELIVDSVESILCMVNNKEEALSHFKHHPVTFQNVQFNIGFANNKGELQEPPYVAYAYLDEGVITYCYNDPFFQQFTDEKPVVESYESAKELVEQKGCLKN